MTTAPPAAGTPLGTLLRRLLRRHRLPLAALLAMQLLQCACMLYLPAVNADLIDHGVLRGDTGYITAQLPLMLALALVQMAALVTVAGLSSWISGCVGHDIREAVFGLVHAFSTREFARHGIPSLVTRTINDVQQVQVFTQTCLAVALSAPVTCVGGILMALRQDVPLACVLVVEVPVLTVVILAIVRRMQPVFRVLQGGIDTVNRILREQITGLRIVRAFRKEDVERARFAAANDALTDSALRAGRLTTLMFPLAQTLVNLTAVPLLLWAAHRVGSGSMPLGAVTAFLSYLTQILVAVVSATTAFAMLPRAQVCAERITQVLSTAPELTPPAVPVRDLDPGRGVRITGAVFTHPGAQEPVLRDIDLVAEPGRTVAVVGSTGSGKSTVLSLVARLADVTSGQVLVGGQDVRDIDPAVLARTVGLVPQGALLLSGTVASNLRYGRPAATDEDLWRALRAAEAEHFVRALDGGLGAAVAQGGSNFSGGQRQRLAMARVLVQRPRVYLLDDPFSALDQATELAVRASLAREVGDGTVLLVTQRIGAAMAADRIVVLDEGRVSGAGTHRELLEHNATYREMVVSQFPDGDPSRPGEPVSR
ncbi:ABC transporter ATP-binding protein [Streptantibioticus silvisoli]|uniref:ABC transporter ATP-binding protein n=1 Tax=Streptantibioticus silvisoli TaxID=2705255 RepID=A0ABT6VRS9_9ACTN|nr:ABC transporter ATP-binding protein [Streptantibioticus silvisoli]MDI5961190.1 ABC transporter ATP-binding protein [Streptantibioticus silvisoli]